MSDSPNALALYHGGSANRCFANWLLVLFAEEGTRLSPLADMRREMNMTVLRPMESESAPRSGERMVCDIHILD
eukprot:scaffold158120_cov41-Tisochrysis_lutea.AAC.1